MCHTNYTFQKKEKSENICANENVVSILNPLVIYNTKFERAKKKKLEWIKS